MLNYTWLYRMVWISGRYGGGKTSLAVAIAAWLCAKSYARFVASNIKLGIGREVAKVTVEELQRVSCNGPVYRDTVILMDEAWSQLGKGTGRKQVVQWLAYMRKANNFLVMPSVLPLVPEVAHLRVERVFNGMVFGLPGWLYKWNLGDYRKGGDRGVYWFNNPGLVFPLYDTKSIPSEEYTIYELWKESDSEKTAQDNRLGGGVAVADRLDGDPDGGGRGGGVGRAFHSVYTSGAINE